MPAQPKYMRIARYIRNLIETDQLKPGDALPTQLELTEQFGVGRLTVRQALQQVIADGYVRAVQGSGTYVLPRRTKTSTKHIALLHACGEHPNPHFLNLIEAASGTARELHVLTTLYGLTGQSKPEEIIAWLEAYAIDSVVLVGVVPEPLVQRIHFEGYPLVAAHQRPPQGLTDKVCYIGTDNQRGTATAITHLRQGGHQNILLTAHEADLEESTQRERMDTFAQLAGSDAIVFVEDERTLTERLTGPERCTAVLASKDITAMHILQRASQLRLPVPSSLAVMGFGGSELGRLTIPPLTTMTEDFFGIGRQCIRQALQFAKGADHLDDVLLRPTLTVRESCGLASRSAEARS